MGSCKEAEAEKRAMKEAFWCASLDVAQDGGGVWRGVAVARLQAVTFICEFSISGSSSVT